ncbi:MAG TPA: FtsX-like permease family protein, partial [Gemmatimonadaceae bacterium]|nr:FtsX-like permease family protein [Gemmatimonadaceae bacterium]
MIDGLRHRLYVLLRGDRYARAVQREHRFHVELAALAKTSNAANAIGAETAARAKFGNAAYYREEVRRMTLQTWIDRARQDASYAVRGLRRSPGFTTAVVVTLALGIGVNASVFSLLDAMFIAPPAGVDHPADVRRLYTDFVNGMTKGAARAVSRLIQFPQYHALRAAIDTSIAIGMYSSADSADLRVEGSRVPVRYEYVQGAYFGVLDVRAEMGRLFAKEEDDIATPAPVAVLSDALWRRAFAADRGIIGRRATIGTRQFTIIGIAARGFRGIDIDGVDLWVPASMNGDGAGPGGPWYETCCFGFNAIVRAPTAAIDRQILATGTNAIRPVQVRGFVYDPKIFLRSGPIVAALGPSKRATEVTVATRIGGVALMVLVIAFANVTNLLLLRASRRRREIAIRRALGVSRQRLIEQLTIESLILAIVGGAVALVVSYWATSALRKLMLPEVHWTTSAVDGRVIVFVIGLAIILGLLTGSLPATQAMHPDLVESLKVGTRGGHQGSRLRNGLLAIQAALCVVLLVGAGLFMRSLENLETVDVGYTPAHALFIQPVFETPGSHQNELAAAIPEAATRLASIDGVQAVAYAQFAPLSGMEYREVFLPGHDSLPKLPG